MEHTRLSSIGKSRIPGPPKSSNISSSSRPLVDSPSRIPRASNQQSWNRKKGTQIKSSSIPNLSFPQGHSKPAQDTAFSANGSYAQNGEQISSSPCNAELTKDAMDRTFRTIEVQVRTTSLKLQEEPANVAYQQYVVSSDNSDINGQDVNVARDAHEHLPEFALPIADSNRGHIKDEALQPDLQPPSWPKDAIACEGNHAQSDELHFVNVNEGDCEAHNSSSRDVTRTQGKPLFMDVHCKDDKSHMWLQTSADMDELADTCLALLSDVGTGDIALKGNTTKEQTLPQSMSPSELDLPVTCSSDPANVLEQDFSPAQHAGSPASSEDGTFNTLFKDHDPAASIDSVPEDLLMNFPEETPLLEESVNLDDIAKEAAYSSACIVGAPTQTEALPNETGDAQDVTETKQVVDCDTTMESAMEETQKSLPQTSMGGSSPTETQDAMARLATFAAIGDAAFVPPHKQDDSIPPDVNGDILSDLGNVGHAMPEAVNNHSLQTDGAIFESTPDNIPDNLVPLEISQDTSMASQSEDGESDLGEEPQVSLCEASVKDHKAAQPLKTLDSSSALPSEHASLAQTHNINNSEESPENLQKCDFRLSTDCSQNVAADSIGLLGRNSHIEADLSDIKHESAYGNPIFCRSPRMGLAEDRSIAQTEFNGSASNPLYEDPCIQCQDTSLNESNLPLEKDPVTKVIQVRDPSKVYLGTQPDKAATPWRALSNAHSKSLEGWETEELTAIQAMAIRYHLKPDWAELLAADPPEHMMRSVQEKHRNSEDLSTAVNYLMQRRIIACAVPVQRAQPETSEDVTVDASLMSFKERMAHFKSRENGCRPGKAPHGSVVPADVINKDCPTELKTEDAEKNTSTQTCAAADLSKNQSAQNESSAEDFVEGSDLTKLQLPIEPSECSPGPHEVEKGANALEKECTANFEASENLADQIELTQPIVSGNIAEALLLGIESYVDAPSSAADQKFVPDCPVSAAVQTSFLRDTPYEVVSTEVQTSTMSESAAVLVSEEVQTSFTDNFIMTLEAMGSKPLSPRGNCEQHCLEIPDVDHPQELIIVSDSLLSMHAKPEFDADLNLSSEKGSMQSNSSASAICDTAICSKKIASCAETDVQSINNKYNKDTHSDSEDSEPSASAINPWSDLTLDASFEATQDKSQIIRRLAPIATRNAQNSVGSLSAETYQGIKSPKSPASSSASDRGMNEKGGEQLLSDGEENGNALSAADGSPGPLASSGTFIYQMSPTASTVYFDCETPRSAMSSQMSFKSIPSSPLVTRNVDYSDFTPRSIQQTAVLEKALEAAAVVGTFLWYFGLQYKQVVWMLKEPMLIADEASIDMVRDLLGESTCALSKDDLDSDSDDVPPVKSGWGLTMTADLESITDGDVKDVKAVDQPCPDVVQVYGAEPSLDEVVPVSHNFNHANEITAEMETASMTNKSRIFCGLFTCFPYRPKRTANPISLNSNAASCGTSRNQEPDPIVGQVVVQTLPEIVNNA